MARYSEHINDKVGREQAEVLQQKLFQAATLALDVAMAENKVPGNLLSACQSILRDRGIAPDMSASEGSEDASGGSEGGVSPSWLQQLQNEVGLPDI